MEAQIRAEIERRKAVRAQLASEGQEHQRVIQGHQQAVGALMRRISEETGAIQALEGLLGTEAQAQQPNQ